MTIPRILVVDDDPEVREMLQKYLQRHGFAVDTAASAQAVRAVVARHRIDLILLDVMLGDDSGLEVCQALRRDSAVPVIMLSALSADRHRMSGYRAGADDYVAKPFNPDLLLARIRAVVGRTRRTPSLAYRRGRKLYRFAGWQFDARTGHLAATGAYEVVLSKREIALLNALLANPFTPLTRDEIAAALEDGRDAGGALEASEGRAIDVLVGRLRSKIEADPAHPALIKTLRGTGYMLAVEVQALDPE